jgi:hypothetical protein
VCTGNREQKKKNRKKFIKTRDRFCFYRVVRWNGGTDPLILNLGTTVRLVVKFRLRQHYSLGKNFL